jgi:hypothetical protein
MKTRLAMFIGSTVADFLGSRSMECNKQVEGKGLGVG